MVLKPLKPLLLGSFIAICSPAFCQSQGLAIGENIPKVDGIIEKDEYAYSKDLNGIRLCVGRTADTISIGIAAPVTGWVAVGLHSLKMNGSIIFMGAVVNGEAQFQSQAGFGYTHTALRDTVFLSSLLSHAVAQEAGITTLEISLKSDVYIRPEDKELNLIYASSKSGSFLSIHGVRGSLKVQLQE